MSSCPLCGGKYSTPDLKFDYATGVVARNGKHVFLTYRECEVFSHIFRRGPIDVRQVADAVYERYSDPPNDPKQNVTVYVSRLRRKLKHLDIDIENSNYETVGQGHFARYRIMVDGKVQRWTPTTS